MKDINKQMAAVSIIGLILAGSWAAFAISKIISSERNKEGVEYKVTAQIVEVGDDGCYSHDRKYTAKKVKFHNFDDSVTLIEVTDEFGESFKEVHLNHIPVIIEEKPFKNGEE